MSIHKKVYGPNTNHLLAALASAQLFGHGNDPVFIEVGGVSHQVKEVHIQKNATSGKNEVLVLTSE